MVDMTSEGREFFGQRDVASPLSRDGALLSNERQSVGSQDVIVDIAHLSRLFARPMVPVSEDTRERMWIGIPRHAFCIKNHRGMLMSTAAER